MKEVYSRCTKTTFSIVLIIFFVSSIEGQDSKLIKPKNLLKDLDQFELFVEAHPDPYTHISKESFEQEIKTLRESLIEPHTQLEFYNKLSALVALIKDGHSSVSLPSNWQLKERKEQGVFPYEVHLTDDEELYITKQYGHTEIPLGAKILSINDLSVDSFLVKVDNLVPHEKKTFRNTIIDGDLQKYLYLVFGVSNKVDVINWG